MAVQYDNWQLPTDTDLAFEWETEWDKLRHYLNTQYFDEQNHFVEACKQGQVVRLTPYGDRQVHRRTHCASLGELDEVISTYRSAERRKGMPDKLAEMIRNNMALPTPILFRHRNEVYCVGGNTRLDVARILEVTPDPKVLLVDLDALDLPIAQYPMNTMFMHSKAA